jgi:hypothetical protein
MTEGGELVAQVGPEAAALLERLGAAVAHVERITALPDRTTGRGTFRVVLADGRRLKVRRLTRASKGARFARLVAELDSPHLPPVLALEGRVCVEPWVDGTALSALGVSLRHLRDAADILGSLHATERLGSRRVRGPRSTRALLHRTASRLAQLGDSGELAPREVAALTRAAARGAPAHALAGVAHTDFCAENLVEDAHGRLVVVDNEGLRLDFLDYDLARTWYRWPMEPAHWSAFLARYARWRPPADEASASFWRVAALAKSVQLRVARGTGREGTPIERLRELAAGPGRVAPLR